MKSNSTYLKTDKNKTWRFSKIENKNNSIANCGADKLSTIGDVREALQPHSRIHHEHKSFLLQAEQRTWRNESDPDLIRWETSIRIVRGTFVNPQASCTPHTTVTRFREENSPISYNMSDQSFRARNRLGSDAFVTWWYLRCAANWKIFHARMNCVHILYANWAN